MTKLKECYVVTDILCDVCGESCKKDDDVFEYATLDQRWGYYSNKDGEYSKQHICESCTDKIMAFIESIRKK
ncbi:MAG: hypothetical protein HY673_18440 [Chloroflexi bacterium]|nr:hypothetical protein [Chloroflexota bacterium]